MHHRSWSQARRFEFIEWKLFWEGRLNRSDLEETFGISTPQASLDLRRYREEAGDNLDYDLSRKVYVSTSKMQPRFLRVSAERLLLQLRAWLTGALRRDDLWFQEAPPVDIAPDITRNVDADCLKAVFKAIRSHQAIRVRYQSLTNSRWRTIAPHALAFDGFRWHVRAWACDHEDFRDFVLSRIDEVGELSSVHYHSEDDLEWHSHVVLRLCAHPGLDEDQRRAIERDYNMVDGRRDIEARLSMAYYYIRRMNLDLDNLEPSRAQVRMQNLSEIEQAVQTARQAIKERIATRKSAAS